MMILEANSDGKITVALSDGSEVEIKIKESRVNKSKVFVRYNYKEFICELNSNSN